MHKQCVKGPFLLPLKKGPGFSSEGVILLLLLFSDLKMNKSDGTQLVSNHFTCASSALTQPLSKLFTAMLQHGYIPKSLRDCVSQPILKPGKDPSDSDNYRPIALAPTVSKIFE